jgi:micrococcal nuclease
MLAFAVALLLLARSASAELFIGQVIGVTDGDTLTILRGGRPAVVRLRGIDAPERGQPYATRAQQYLAGLAFGQVVTVDSDERDRYGRLVAEVRLPDGRSLSQELVRAGYAWWFRRYSSDPTLARPEAEARIARRGLWADPSPTPPWTYRAERGSRGRLRTRGRPDGALDMNHSPGGSVLSDSHRTLDSSRRSAACLNSQPEPCRVGGRARYEATRGATSAPSCTVPLPLRLPLQVGGLEVPQESLLALGRFNALSTLLPDPHHDLHEACQASPHPLSSVISEEAAQEAAHELGPLLPGPDERPGASAPRRGRAQGAARGLGDRASPGSLPAEPGRAGEPGRHESAEPVAYREQPRPEPHPGHTGPPGSGHGP